jgi:beta-N-acetylhexosaminidase
MYVLKRGYLVKLQQYPASHKSEPVNDDPDITRKHSVVDTPIAEDRISSLEAISTRERPTTPMRPAFTREQHGLTRKGALLLIALLSIIVLHALTIGPTQFLGSQGWSFVLSETAANGNANLLQGVSGQLHHPTTGATAPPQLTPQQYIDLIVHRMTLDQKIGQMMLVQFVGSSYSANLSTMITQYNVGAVLIFTANGNVQSKQQLTDLIQQMQSNSPVPLAVAIDQEGGTVDRLVGLDGPRPAAATIGATHDPAQAMAAGEQDARDLASYGINLNLAPVVDVTNVYNPQLYDRTFGDTPDLVTQMAGAYLKGLQQSGKVIGTLKHFPGLGDVGVDPHVGVPRLTRPLNELEQIDWAPYRTLIQQGDVHAIMVTHEIVTSVDSSVPSSLSYKLITGILRQQLGFQGVIMTDSLTMEGMLAYYSEDQAAALAVEAGDDLLMGASTPADVAAMIEGIKQAVNAGTISQQRIDASVERILMMKYDMGLLPLPTY